MNILTEQQESLIRLLYATFKNPSDISIHFFKKSVSFYSLDGTVYLTFLPPHAAVQNLLKEAKAIYKLKTQSAKLKALLQWSAKYRSFNHHYNNKSSKEDQTMLNQLNIQLARDLLGIDLITIGKKHERKESKKVQTKGKSTNRRHG